MTNPDLPVVLQPALDFPPRRGSIFDDPGDEKSARISQRGAGLTAHFAGREPAWYASAIEPLEGVDSVLDLGCGLGLTLEALRDQGADRVLGVDRWFTFVERATEATPMVAHDLTLPMPFLDSGCFDGVFSHYVLDYMSPIGVRQVLREARRILTPGGMLLAYVSGVGLGGADVARTIPYRPAPLRRLLSEAGFEEIDVEAPAPGRNSVVKARRSPHEAVCRAPAGELRAELRGDTQLSAAFVGGGERIECELSGEHSRMRLAFDLPPEEGAKVGRGRVSVCIRALALHSEATELRIWVWLGRAPVLTECVRLGFVATELSVGCAGAIEHSSVWTPGEISLEPLGDACARPAELAAESELSEIERAEEGRKVAVERRGEARANASVLLGKGHNRFLVRRAHGLSAADLDEEWLAGRAHGVVLSDAELCEDRGLELLLWARWREAPVFVDGDSWQGILAAVSARAARLPASVVLVDPALGGDSPPGPVAHGVASLAESRPSIYVVLSGQSRDRSPSEGLKRLRDKLLHGGPSGEGAAGMAEAGETLRCLTERILLGQVRQWRPFSWAEVGRRPVRRPEPGRRRGPVSRRERASAGCRRRWERRRWRRDR